jgi:glycosyltransferase involved in cell wall biosynthesis
LSSALPVVSLIVPCRNEAGYIEQCLASLLAMDYPVHRLEILVADGMSDDGTQAIVRRIMDGAPAVRLLENPPHITSAALNRGIAAATGEVIFIIGAHSQYPDHYVRRLVEHLQSSGADAVGGMCVTEPGADTPVARAIATALSHPFGVGNSHFRIGAQTARWVDTVPFGGYRRSVFERFGGFDEELIRNQDDEFNLRILKGGGRLLLVPEVVSRYYARPAVRQVARMFYQYGLYKPLVARKLGRVMTLRQVIPALFVLALALSATFAFWSGTGRVILALVLTTYVAADVTASLLASARTRCSWLHLAATFPVVHLSYGFGFLVGALRLLRRGRFTKESPVSVPLSR